jgi:hypothetical protein
MKYIRDMLLFNLAPDGGVHAQIEVSPILLDTTLEFETFDDALPHQLASVEIFPARSAIVVIAVTAHDEAGQRSAGTVQPAIFTRFGTGAVLVNGSPLPQPFGLSYNGYPPPWTSLTSTIVTPSPGIIAVEIVGLPGVPIKWRATMLTFGTQVQ